MQAILIANPKGGVGKSTLATTLAGYLAGAGKRVMLGDIDRQQSTRDWLKLRSATLPPIGTWLTEPDKPARPPKGTTHAVLDTPAGLHGKKLEAVLKIVDKVIVPLQPAPFDMRATRAFLDLLLQEKHVRQGKTFVAIVGNRVDPRTRAARALEEFLSEYSLPVLGYLRDSQVYVHAAAAGLTLFDLPESRTEKDRLQWSPIIKWVEEDNSRLTIATE